MSDLDDMIDHVDESKESLRRAADLARTAADKTLLDDAAKRVDHAGRVLREHREDSAHSGAAWVLALSLSLAGCSTTVAAQLERVQLGVQAVAVVATTAAHAECSRRAMECGRQGIIPATCVEKDACQAVRRQLVTALVAAGEAVAAANRAVWSLGLERKK